MGSSYKIVDSKNNKIEQDPGLYSISDVDSTCSGELYQDEYDDPIYDWEENVHNLKLILGLQIVPLISRLVGRNIALWMWSKLRVIYQFPSFRQVRQ
ncbi:hypothetical protein K502DRAFT_368990 [Neoconidiobolus thromboides FSU 785]|nr:hypothetical protein K502DRAFT_368990 [Neoconidiobolus thromboides FSU 785]